MSRARPVLVIAGALALFPLGYAVAKIVVDAIVVPTLPDFSDSGFELPWRTRRPRLIGQHELGSAEAGANRHSYYLDIGGEELPSAVCLVREQIRMVAVP